MQLGIPTRVVGNMTTSITNVVDTTEIYEWHKQRFGEYPYNSMVDSPSYMSIKNIPSKFKTQIESHLTMPEVIGYLNIDIKYPNAFREWIKWMKRIDRYREQLDRLGFSFDWDREVQTSDPRYYKWTQWIFKQFFDSYYCIERDKAIKISSLILSFYTKRE